MTSDVHEYNKPDFNATQIESIARLELAAFSSTRTLADRFERIAGIGGEPNEKRFVIWKKKQAVAAARTFHRVIFVAGRELNVLALASVCTDPSCRGEGLGRLIVTAAFKDVESNKFDLSLFQTGVSEFYEKLNCRLIENEILNRKSPESDPPFSDAHAMIYPSNYDWPEGTVDLNGDGY